MEKKEQEEFLIRLGGALTGGIEDSAFEMAWKAYGLYGVFPYVEVNPALPPADDLIVGGLAIPPWVLGYLLEADAKKKGDTKTQEMGKNIKMFGEGNMCYSLPMLLRLTLLKNLRLGTPGSAVPVRPSAPPAGSPPQAATVIRL